MRQAARSLCAAAAAAGAARLGLRAARGLAHSAAGSGGVLDEQRWSRTNHRGEPVTLLEGPVYAAAAAAGVLAAPALPGRVRTAGALAALGAGAFGVYDDLYGNADRRGIRGHLTALARGEVTTGGVKLAGIGALGVLGGALTRRGGSSLDKALAAVVIAGAANAVNLLDLRPGRAIKGATAAAVPGLLRRALEADGGGALPGGAARGGAYSGADGGAYAAANVLVGAGLGAAFALLPEDLGESAMLGDAGANALGALLGTAAALGARSTAGLAWRAAALTAVNLASEKVSFTKVIANWPPLNAVDLWGRRPAGVPRVPAQARANSVGEYEQHGQEDDFEPGPGYEAEYDDLPNLDEDNREAAKRGPGSDEYGSEDHSTDTLSAELRDGDDYVTDVLSADDRIDDTGARDTGDSDTGARDADYRIDRADAPDTDAPDIDAPDTDDSGRGGEDRSAAGPDTRG
jgi:UDP-N-acetylmuramyl pentapeptide phosphotransferase/UDP-N-acetylglucosamine-1-phosphate transferase